MPTSLKYVIGAQRVTPNLDPNAADYLPIMKAQMDQVKKNFEKLMNAMPQATLEVLIDALEPTYEKSQEYCPKDTGELVASGYLEITELSTKVRVEMGYGKGGNPPYTIFVHERTDLKHKAPTQAKFLQRAIEEDSEEIANRVEKGMKELFS